MSDHSNEPTAGLDLRAAALHALRLKGFADTPVIAQHLDTQHVDDVELCLKALARDGLVLRRDGARSGWVLTASGRAENERLLAEQLDAGALRRQVQTAYRAFTSLNRRVLEACSSWQVKDLDAQLLNDHTDPAYDEAVIETLASIDEEAQRILARLATSLARFSRYGPALASALGRVRRGDQRWFTGPTIASYHTVWFELHEDLLATLGLDRALEAETTPGG